MTLDICNPNNRDTIIVGNAFVGGLGSLSGIGRGESHKKVFLTVKMLVDPHHLTTCSDLYTDMTLYDS